MYDDIAEEVGMNKSTLATFKSVSQSVEPLLRNKDLSFNHHKEVASLPPEKQEYFLGKAVDEDLSVRELREQIRRSGIEESNPDLPDGKFRIFYADPPWKYGNSMPTYFKEQAETYLK
jgi:hypothetical protein